MNDEFGLDGTLRAAADDVRREMMSVEVGEFRPSRGPGPAVAIVAAVLVAVAGLGALVQASDNSTVIEVGPAETTADEEQREEPIGNGESSETPQTDSAPDQSIVRLEPAVVDLTTLNTSTAPAPLSTVTEPAVGVAVAEPAFGTEIVRITGDESSPSAVPLPSGGSLWNADESLLLLYRPGDGHMLHDGTTGALLRPIAIPAADIEQVFWSATDPNTLYYVDGVDFSALDVSTGRATVRHRFEGCDRVDSGSGPMPPSFDDRLWGLVCQRADGDAELIAYHLDDDQEFRLAAPNPERAPVPSASGDSIVVIDGPTATVYDPTLSTPMNAFQIEDRAAPVAAVDDAGRDVIVVPEFSLEPTGTLVAYDLATGDAAAVIGAETGHGPAATGAATTSAGGVQPGLVAVAVRSDGSDPTLVAGEILVADLTRGLVIRVAHHRAPGEDYFISPFVTLSRRGDRILFSGDRDGDGVADSYLVTLPTS